jgi:hypothetical protein
VRIQGPFNFDQLDRPGGGKASSGKAKSSRGRDAEVSGDSEVVPAHQNLIKAALSAQEVRPQVVEAARQALQAGELDTPEAALGAARRMLEFGA